MLFLGGFLAGRRQSTATADGALSPAFPPALAAVRHIDAATPRDTQIALAEAAGAPVSAEATIYILGPKGYVKARQGTNGFTCLVERPLRPDTLAPTCYDAEGSATTLQASLYVEEQRAAGRDEATIESAVAAGYRNGRFLAPRRSGIAYMLYDHNYLLDAKTRKIIDFPGHLMFYAPYATTRDIGTGPGAPGLTAPGHATNFLVVIPAGSHVH